MDVKSKLLFIIPSMRGGGSERVISLLVRNLDRKKFNITLVLLKKEGPYLRDIPQDINIIDLNSPRLRQAVFALPQVIRQTKPDIVISTLSHLNIFLSIIKPFFDKKIKFISRESSIVSVNNKNTPYPKFFDFLYSRFYNNFDKIIAQSHYMKQDMVQNYGINEGKIHVINNPVDIEKITQMAECKERLFDTSKINLLTVGRLGYEKGYDMLLSALSILDDNYHLTIIGEGTERHNLEKMVKKLDIPNKISFIGFQENPYKYMKQADLLILTSRHEGFPNVVLEANTCGTPVVAFNCPGGTGEIIENDVNGSLVPCKNIEKLAETIVRTSNDTWHKETIKKLIYSQYNLQHIIEKYEKTLL